MGMFILFCIALLVLVTACIAKAFYIPRDPKENIEDYIFKRYGIDIQQLQEEDNTEYEIIIDKKTGKRVIREKTKEDKNDIIPDIVYVPFQLAFCARQG